MIKVNIISEFLVIIERIKDYRKGVVTYPLEEVLFLVFCGKLLNCQSWIEFKEFGDFSLKHLRKFLPYQNGVPSSFTISRIISNIDSTKMNELLKSMASIISEHKQSKRIALDGKKIGDDLYTVNAYCANSSVALMQSDPYTAGNELTHIKQLLDVLHLKKSVVSIDSIACNKEIADKIRSKGGYMLLAVKGNQPYLHKQIKNFFDTKRESNFAGLNIDCSETVEKGHGRVETRKATTLHQFKYIPELKHWKGVKQVIEIESTRWINGKETIEHRYYISGYKHTALEALHLIRQHWRIENNLHWQLDTTFNEDDCPIENNNARTNIATINRIMLNVIKTIKDEKISIAAFLRKTRFSPKYFNNALTSFLNIFLT